MLNRAIGNVTGWVTVLHQAGNDAKLQSMQDHSCKFYWQLLSLLHHVCKVSCSCLVRLRLMHVLQQLSKQREMI